MNDEQTKIALVTGANKGIGFAICQGLLKAGFEVILAARSLERGKAAAAQLSSDRVRVVELDVTDDNRINLAIAQLSKEISHLDVLINNAGIYPDEGVNILTVSRDLLNLTANTNAFSPIRVTQACLPLLTKTTTAKIINVSSGYGQINGLSADVPSYCLSKLTLNGATIMLADALRPQNIAVYAFCPGWVMTDMGGASAPRSPEQGADTAIWLAESGSLDMSGKLFRDRQEISY